MQSSAESCTSKQTSYSKRCSRVFLSPSTLCPYQHLRNDLLSIAVSGASILPTVCDFSRLSLSAKKRLHTEASLTTTRKLLKQHREHFPSSKSNDIDRRAAFPDSVTPKERVRAQVRPPLTSLYNVHYSAVNAWPTPQQYSTSVDNLRKRYPITQVQYANGCTKQRKGLDH